MRNDYLDYLAHSSGPWKDHKYLKKIGDKYIYAKEAVTNAVSDAVDSAKEAITEPLRKAEAAKALREKESEAYANQQKNVKYAMDDLMMQVAELNESTGMATKETEADLKKRISLYEQIRDAFQKADDNYTNYKSDAAKINSENGTNLVVGSKLRSYASTVEHWNDEIKIATDKLNGVSAAEKVKKNQGVKEETQKTIEAEPVSLTTKEIKKQVSDDKKKKTTKLNKRITVTYDDAKLK